MRETICLDEYGTQLNVACDGVSFEEFFQAVCLPHWKLNPPVSGATTLRLSKTSADPQYPWKADWNDDCLLIAASPAELFRQLESFLHAHFAENSSNPFFVHAGAVACGGSCLIFPASTYSGKSTLVQALVTNGAEYMSDEFALIDRVSSRIKAFPRRLHLREPSPSTVSLPAPSGDAIVSGLPVRAIYFLKYRKGATLEVTPLSTGQAVLQLFENTVAAQSVGGPTLFPVFARLCSEAKCFQGFRGDANLAAKALLERH